jgi:hypothetical protein
LSHSNVVIVVIVNYSNHHTGRYKSQHINYTLSDHYDHDHDYKYNHNDDHHHQHHCNSYHYDPGIDIHTPSAMRCPT